MELLFTWLSSTIISYGINIINKLKMFKDIADDGYKINMEKYRNIPFENKNNVFKRIIFLIPIINILSSMKDSFEYLNYKEATIFKLKLYGALDDMSLDEKNKYQKKPFGIYAYYMSIKMAKKLKNAHKITIPNTNGRDNIIYFNFDKKLNIDIIKAEGNISYKSKNEQIKMINDYMKESVDDILNKLMEKEEKQEISSQQKKINELTDLKNKLIEVNKNKDNGNNSEKEKTYIKKK